MLRSLPCFDPLEGLAGVDIGLYESRSTSGQSEVIDRPFGDSKTHRFEWRAGIQAKWDSGKNQRELYRLVAPFLDPRFRKGTENPNGHFLRLVAISKYA